MRRQLQETNDAFDKHKVHARQEYEKLQTDLAEKHRREMEALKDKYERML